MQNYPDYAFFNTGIDRPIIENIFQYVSENVELESARVGSGENSSVEKNIRNCLSGNIPRQHWINGILDYYVKEVNREIFNYELIGWHDDLQFLFYDEVGSGYKWHSDISAEPNSIGIRKLSLVLCLSSVDDYDGGEFQIILDGRTEMSTLKLDTGDCILFPSTALHRVRPLKSGERTTIVGWYGGPDFR